MDNIRRKFLVAREDIQQYWYPVARRKAVKWCGVLLYVLGSIAMAVVKVAAPKLAPRALNLFGRLLWKFRDIGLGEILPPMRNLVYARHMNVRGELVMEDFGFNLRTNQGADWQCNRMGQAPATGTLLANFISVYNASGYTPATGDTEATIKANELTGGGFGRVVGSYSHSNGTSTYALSTTYTCTAAGASAYGAGLFDTSPTGGNNFCSKLFGTPALMVSGDTLAVTWTIQV